MFVDDPGSSLLAWIQHLLTSPWFLLSSVFQLWMLAHALMNREWLWAIFIFFAPLFGPLWYFMQMYRGAPSVTRGFELPGAAQREQIKHLQTQIHLLDKAHHHQQLGDVYFQQGKLALAEASYRAAMERDPQDLDTRAHYGQCLLRLKRPAEARPLLEGVCQQDLKHDYGHSLMALAETYSALGEVDRALTVWERVTQNHSYARARVQLAELYLGKQHSEKARALLDEVINDAPHSLAFARRRERVWVRRAKTLRRQLPRNATSP